MRRFITTLSCLTILLFCTLPLATAADNDIVPVDSKLELLFTRSRPAKTGLTEGPAAAPDGKIYFSDLPFGQEVGMIMCFDPKTKQTTVFAADSGKSNGLKFDAHGDLIACQGADY